MTVLLVGQGTTMMMLGVLGEYLWRTYDEARGRPRYIVRADRLAAIGARRSHSKTVGRDREKSPWFVCRDRRRLLGPELDSQFCRVSGHAVGRGVRSR